jgi:hypothetical protein
LQSGARNLHVDLLATVFAPLASGAVKTLGAIFQMVEQNPPEDTILQTAAVSPGPMPPPASLLCAFADAAVHAMVTGLAKQKDTAAEIGPNPRKTTE